MTDRSLDPSAPLTRYFDPKNYGIPKSASAAAPMIQTTCNPWLAPWLASKPSNKRVMKFVLKVWLSIILVPIALWLGGLALVAALAHGINIFAVALIIGALWAIEYVFTHWPERRQGDKGDA
jgi:hypothetical protein